MPNHCDNRLTITGPPAAVAGFVDRANGPTQHYAPAAYEIEDARRLGRPLPQRDSSVFSFHRFIPIPEAIEAGQYSSDGYEAERRLWGVKWGAYAERLASHTDGRADYEFQTAWAPALQFLRAVSAMPEWRGLTFLLSYGEEYPTRGRHVIAGGVVLDVAAGESSPQFHGDGECDTAADDGECSKCAAYGVWQNEYVESHAAWVAAHVASEAQRWMREQEAAR